jgi:elongation factor Ts
MVKAEDVAKLRNETGAGVMECKKALEDANGDYNKAKTILAGSADAIAKKKAERATKSGLVEAYVHAGRIGVLIEVDCESDFVAKNADFKNLVHNLAMQIASMNPNSVEELLKQEYILDSSQIVDEYVKSIVLKIRENIQIKRFTRYEVGEEIK